MTIDVQSLLQPVSPDEPCGPNLEYDAEFIVMESAAQGKPEQQYGETKIEAEPPDWKQVRKIGLELMTRTKDLRVACLVARAMLEVEGIDEFCQTLQIIRDYIENHWNDIHPLLDPDDENDPTWRVNTLSSLNDFNATIEALHKAPLVDAGMVGRFSMTDIEIANGDSPAPADSEPPMLANVEAAFEQVDAETLVQRTAALREGSTHIAEIESLVTDHVGAAQATSFDTLTKSMHRIRELLEAQLLRLGIVAEPPSQPEVEPIAQPQQTAAPQPVVATPNPATATITTRDDVIRALDRICEYYERFEPSSPVPLFLRRARRLASMNFLDIVRELTPESLSKAKTIGGVGHDTVEDQNDYQAEEAEE